MKSYNAPLGYLIKNIAARCPMLKGASDEFGFPECGIPELSRHEMHAAAQQLRCLTNWFRQNPTKRYKGDMFDSLADPHAACLMGARQATRKFGIKMDRAAVRNLNAQQASDFFMEIGLVHVNDQPNISDKDTFQIFDKVADMLDTFAVKATGQAQHDADLWVSLTAKKFPKIIKENKLDLKGRWVPSL